MSKPRHEEGDIRQLATWVPADVKEKLTERAAEEGKAVRLVVTEALIAHLGARVAEDDES